MAHLWSGRFEGDPDAALFEFGASFRFDRRLFEDDVTGSRAWAEALERAGVLSRQDAAGDSNSASGHHGEEPLGPGVLHVSGRGTGRGRPLVRRA